MADKNDSKFVGSERSSDEIRNDIAARRESISLTVGQLGDKVHQTLDWKAYVARYPYAAIGLTVGAGLILGSLLKRKPSSSGLIVDVLVDKAEQLGDSLRDSVRKLFPKTAAPHLFRGTIYGIAGTALMNYLRNRAIHAEGNGGNLSHEYQWREGRSTTVTLPNVS